MLRITTTNGDTLIHADQQSDAMKLTATDGSQVIVHAGEWGKHKYIRKEGNRYIYPEDLEKAKNTAANIGNGFANTARMIGSKAQSAYNTTAPKVSGAAKSLAKETKQVGQDVVSTGKKAYGDAKETASNVISDQKLKAKDRKYVRESPEAGTWKTGHIESNKRNDTNRMIEKGEKIRRDKQNERFRSTTTTGTAKEIEAAKRRADKQGEGYSTEDLEIQKEKTAIRKKHKANLDKAASDTDRRKKTSQQQKSAHSGYEADKRKFGDEPTSTEELELQKRKTASRKARQKSVDEIRRANRTKDQQKAAHQGKKGNTSLDEWGPAKAKYIQSQNTIEEQKRKTKTRKIIKANKARTEAQANSAHRYK